MKKLQSFKVTKDKNGNQQISNESIVELKKTAVREIHQSLSERKLQSYKSTKNRTGQVRIDCELIRRLKILAADQETSIKSLVEGALRELLAVEGEK